MNRDSVKNFHLAALLLAVPLLLMACTHRGPGPLTPSDEVLSVGDRAPNFVFTDMEGRIRTLADLLEEGPAVVYFYPADFTRGCTAQACMVRDRSDALRGAGISAIGISPQDKDSHERFQEEYDLNFPLVPDTDKRIISAYGVNGPGGNGVQRATFLVNQRGRISDVVLAGSNIEAHSELIDRAIVFSSTQ